MDRYKVDWNAFRNEPQKLRSNISDAATAYDNLHLRMLMPSSKTDFENSKDLFDEFESDKSKTQKNQR